MTTKISKTGLQKTYSTINDLHPRTEEKTRKALRNMAGNSDEDFEDLLESIQYFKVRNNRYKASEPQEVNIDNFEPQENIVKLVLEPVRYTEQFSTEYSKAEVLKFHIKDGQLFIRLNLSKVQADADNSVEVTEK